MKQWMMILMLEACLCGCSKRVDIVLDDLEEDYQQLLIIDELNREDYESDQVYSLGDPIVFLGGEQKGVLWQVTLNDYEIVEDSNDEFKQALILHFNYRYLLPDLVISQMLQPVIQPVVFYQDIALKTQSLAEATVAYNLGNYEASPHILYEPVVNDEIICKLVYLKANTEQNCFSYYSYAGPGEYLISFETSEGEFINYVIDVHEKDETT